MPNRSQRLLGLFFIGAGAMHFVNSRFYVRITPKWVPRAKEVVYVTGVAEMAGGVGMLLPQTRKLSGLSLIALLLGVFPANVQMATDYDQFRDMKLPRWALWARLPLQPLLIWLTWRASQRVGTSG